MSLINYDLVKRFFSNNFQTKKDSDGKSFVEYTPVKYRWTHGATDKHLGDGILIYAAIQYMRAKTCVCLGSGGGFVPRIMTQARMDLHDQEIFEGQKLMEWGDVGTTILVDANNGINGYTDWVDENSFLRSNFPCRIIIDSTENAFYNFFIKEDIKIDYLHIDAGHSYENIRQDFELYSSIMAPHGIISIHDTDETYSKEYIVSKDILDQNHHDDFTNGPRQFIKEVKDGSEVFGDWEVFNFFNNGVLKTKPASTGLTFLQRCKI